MLEGAWVEISVNNEILLDALVSGITFIMAYVSTV